MPPIDTLIESLADRYRIEHRIGSGGMATVYLAEDVRHRRKVAVKVLRPELGPVVGADRFDREIAIAAQLQHPHILPLLDSGDAAGHRYYVMPYVAGETLHQRLKRDGPLPTDEAIRLLAEIADALSHAHERGVVHRDIKPENVMISGHHALVMDFGIAKAIADGQQPIHSEPATGPLTTAGIAVGTPTYMSPEQASGDPNIDHRADIYAVGVLAYELLTGRPPFTDQAPQAILAAHVIEKPKPIGELRDDLPPELETLVMDCLAKRPSDRPQTAAAIHVGLGTMMTPASGSRRIVSVRKSGGVSRWRRRRTLLAAAGIVATVAVVAAAAWTLRPSGSAPIRADTTVMMILPFRVSGADQSLGYLREGMLDLLATKFSGSGGLRPVDPGTLLGAWRRRGGRPNEDLTREQSNALSAELGAGRTLEGSIVGASHRITVSVTLFDRGAGAAAAQSSVEGPEDSLSVLLDRLAGQVLVQVGIPSARGSELTHSLPALRSYLDGLSAYRAGRYDLAGRALDRALDGDSAFALAAMMLVQTADWAREIPGVGRAERVLQASLGRLSSRDRLLLAAFKGPRYPASSNLREITTAAEEAVVAAPDQPDAWYYLGDSYYHSGELLGYPDALVRARTAFRRVIELAPEFQGPREHLIEILALERDTAGLQPFRAGLIDGSNSRRAYLLWRIAAATGDSSERSRHRARFDSLTADELERVLIHVIADGLDPLDGDAALAAQARRTTRLDASGLLLSRAGLAISRGRPIEAERLLGQITVTRPSDRDLADRQRIMSALYAGGDRTAAARAASLWPPGVFHCLSQLWRTGQNDTVGVAHALATVRGKDDRCARAVEARLAIIQRRPDARALLERLDSLVRAGEAGWGFYVAPMLGHAYLDLGDTTRAAGAFRRRMYAQTIPETSYIADLAVAGRLALATGDTAWAVRAFRTYLGLRDDPEPTLIPERDSVRAVFSRLVGPASRLRTPRP